jgi:TonB family protein
MNMLEIESMKMTIWLIITTLVAGVFTETVQAQWLVINSIPAAAEVSVDNRMTGYTPLRLEGAEGQIIRVSISIGTLDTFSFEHVFSENRTICIDLENKTEIDEDHYWRKKTVSVAPEIAAPTETPAPQRKTLLGASLKNITDPPDIPSTLHNESGDVILDLAINTAGTVVSSTFLTESSNDELKRYLTEWVATWSFEPATLSGDPIDGNTKIKIEYALETGEFALPTYDLTVIAGRETAVPADIPVEEIPPVEPAETVENQYYNDEQVDRKATVYSPPPLGDIPVDIINLELSGVAEFTVYINTEGNVEKVDIVSGTGNQSLDEYIIKMIRKSYWEPAANAGKPVGYMRNLTLEYNTKAVRFNYPDL